jgi:2-isopropylmalate synthase
VSEGTGALAEVTVRVKDLYSGRTFVGHGTHVDVVEASGEAYLDAVNSLFTMRDAEAEQSASLRFPKAKQAKVSA